MLDYHATAQQKEAELKADPAYAASRRRWRIGTAAGLGIGLALFGFFASPVVGVVDLLIGGVGGWFLGTWINHRRARGQARDYAKTQYLQAWAAQRGLTHAPTAPIYDDVPMLRQGERWSTGDQFSGPIMGDITGSIYNFTYETRETRTTTDSNGGTRTETYWQPHPQTVLRLDLPLDLTFLSVRARATKLSKLFDGVQSKFSAHRTVELESIEFSDGFDLEVHDDDDDVLVRTIFDPTLILMFVERRATLPPIQANGSHLVAMRAGHFDCTDSDGLGELERLLDAARPVVEKMAFNVRNAKAGTS